MSRVASEASILHPPHHNLGGRSRAASTEARQPASPFSLLVGATDTPPPPAQDHGERRPVGRAASADDARLDKGAPKTPDKPKPDDGAGSTAAVDAPRDAKVVQNDGATADPAAVQPEQVHEPAPTDATEAALLTAAAGDPKATQPTPTQAATVAPVATEAALAATATAATDAGLAQTVAPNGAVKAGASGLKADGVIATNGEAGQKGTTQSSNPDTSQPADAAAADADQTAAPDPAIQEAHGEGHALPDPAAQDKVRHAHLHADPASQPDTQQPEDVLARFDAQAGATAHGGKGHLEGAQLASLQQPTDRLGTATTAAVQAPTPADSATAGVPIAGLAVEIAARAQAGRNRFDIRLDPPELGRIDVRLDVDKSGNVTSRLLVERAETLDVLRRDAGELERALQQAGLKTADNGLQFALRDQTFAGRQDPGAAPNMARLVVPDPDLVTETLPVRNDRLARAGGGIDIRV